LRDDAGVGERVGTARSSLLELAEACAVPVRWSCRTGLCQTCRRGLLAGAVTYALEPLEPLEVLLCCARPVTEVVLDLWRHADREIASRPRRRMFPRGS
jgi:ferredoxin